MYAITYKVSGESTMRVWERKCKRPSAKELTSIRKFLRAHTGCENVNVSVKDARKVRFL